MAIGTKSDFQILHEQFHAGMTEVIARNTDVFNEQSEFALVLDSELQMGDYRKETFFTEISSLIRRRDPTSTAASTADKLSQAQNVSVKIRSSAHIEQTLDALRAIQMGEDEFSFVLGQQIGKSYLADKVSNAIRALSSAIAAGGSLEINDNTISTNLRTQDLTAGFKTFGDASNNIVAFLTHSAAYWDLVQGQIDTHNQYELANNIVVFGRGAGGFNRPFIVVDDPLLIDSGAGDSGEDLYHTYGLARNACVFTESEMQELLFETVGGNDNLLKRFQWEASCNLDVKGYAWDITNGGDSPDNTALAASGNWDKVASDDKNTAGFRIITLSGV